MGKGNTSITFSYAYTGLPARISPKTGTLKYSAISSLIFGGKGTWTIEIIRPVEQIKSAFLDSASMGAFIDGIYTTVENAFKLEEERLVALAVNTAIANSIKGGVSRNLLQEYNTAHTDNTLTVDKALESADFLRFASKEINRTIEKNGKILNIESSRTDNMTKIHFNEHNGNATDKMPEIEMDQIQAFLTGCNSLIEAFGYDLENDE